MNFESKEQLGFKMEGSIIRVGKGSGSGTQILSKFEAHNFINQLKDMIDK